MWIREIANSPSDTVDLGYLSGFQYRVGDARECSPNVYSQNKGPGRARVWFPSVCCLLHREEVIQLGR